MSPLWWSRDPFSVCPKTAQKTERTDSSLSLGKRPEAGQNPAPRRWGMLSCVVCPEAANINCPATNCPATKQLPEDSGIDTAASAKAQRKLGLGLPDLLWMTLTCGGAPRELDPTKRQQPCSRAVYLSIPLLSRVAGCKDHSWKNFYSLTEKTPLDPQGSDPISLFSFLLYFISFIRIRTWQNFCSSWQF